MKSIFSKLIVSFTAIILFVILFISILFSGLLKNYLISQKEEELKNKGSQIAELTTHLINKDIDEDVFLFLVSSIDEVVNSRTVIIDRSGTILNSPPGPRGRNSIYFTKGMRFNDKDVANIFNGDTVIKSGYNPVFKEPMITVGIPVYSGGEGSPIIRGVILNSPVTGINAALNKTKNILIWVSLGALVISLLGAFFLSGTISKPVHTISKAALEIAEGNYTKKVDIKRKDEIGNLASTFNYLTDRLNEIISDLNNEKSKLSDILFSMEEGLIAVNNRLEIIHINPAALTLLNVEKNAFTALMDIIESEDIVDSIREVLQSGRSNGYEYNMTDTKVIRIIISPLKFKDGVVYGAIVLLQDVSESVKLERMRRDFVANVSHELRTPLTSIRGFIEPLVDGTVDDDVTRLKYHKIIRDETLRLERLINDLLDLSRLQSGKVKLDIQRVDIIELIYNVSAKFQPLFKSKNISFEFITPDKPMFISADGDRVEQLIVIFIDNAIKYTPGGGAIKIRLIEETEHICIAIEDNGIGIPDEDLPYIWERFYKVDKSRTDKKSGTGLGLSIAKNIIELHGEKVFVKSKLNEGTTFEFTMKKDM